MGQGVENSGRGIKTHGCALWPKGVPTSSEMFVHQQAYGRLVEAEGKSGPPHARAPTFQLNACLRLGLPPSQKSTLDHAVCTPLARVERDDKPGYHFMDAHCNLVGQNI